MSLLEETLNELEKTKEQYWNISPKTGDYLANLIIEKNLLNVLELGTSNGYSAIRMALALKKINGHLTTIEYWQKRRVLALENFEKCGVAEIITSKLGDALTVIKAELLNEKYDLIFMDANKAGYSDFFVVCQNIINPNGYIVADDVLSHAQQVQSFIDKINNSKKYEVKIIDLPDGVLVAQLL